MTGHGKERTHKETLKHVQMTNSLLLKGKQTPVFGVKGTTWFIYVPGFDIIGGIALEYMHCILLGVMKMLLNLWFDKAYIEINHFMYAAKSKQLIVSLL